MKSLSKKYFSIPKKYHECYPEAVNIKVALNSNKKDIKRHHKRKLESVNRVDNAKRKVGRPKKVVEFHGLETITKFFRPV